jgi:1-acyl-sn-glycerol-3-phosphate acyltransferase
MRIALSLLFWALFAAMYVLAFPLALAVFLLTFPFDPRGRVLHLFSCWCGSLGWHLNPYWRLRVEGREKLPWRGAAVLVANHQSLADVFAMYALKRPFKWVAKKSLFNIPFLGWMMRMNRYVAVKRGLKSSMIRMMLDCEHWLDSGVPVLFFPEGTRSEDGEVQDFRDGAFALAVRKQCPVYPIVIVGTRAALPKHGLVIEGQADCLVKVLDPVSPKDFEGDLERLRDQVRQRIIEEKRRLETTGLPGASRDQTVTNE